MRSENFNGGTRGKGPKRGTLAPHHKGMRPGYANAIAMCAANGWQVGDVLASERWSKQKRIVSLRPSLDEVALADCDSASRSETDRLPVDTRKAS